MKGWEEIRKMGWILLAGLVLGGSLMASVAQAAESQTQKPWSVGGTMGFLANTPDDTAFALNFNAEANLNRRFIGSREIRDPPGRIRRALQTHLARWAWICPCR